MITIEAPSPADVPSLLQIIRAKAQFDKAEHTLQQDEATLTAALFSERPAVCALIARSADGIVGIATYYRIYSTFLGKTGYWMDDLFVAAAHRGKGIGRDLMKRLCALAMDEGCARIDWVVGANNHSGQKFYRRVGAEIFENARHARLTAGKIAALART